MSPFPEAKVLFDNDPWFVVGPPFKWEKNQVVLCKGKPCQVTGYEIEYGLGQDKGLYIGKRLTHGLQKVKDGEREFITDGLVKAVTLEFKKEVECD